MNREVARRIAVVLQEMPGDFPFTVRDVVMMGRVPWREGLAGWTDQDEFTIVTAAGEVTPTLTGPNSARVDMGRAGTTSPDFPDEVMAHFEKLDAVNVWLTEILEGWTP